MSIPKDITSKHLTIDAWAILSGYRGSIAHGMYVPKDNPNSIDDKDVMTVFLAPFDYYTTLETHGLSRGTKEILEGEWDVVCYEFKKFISLLIKGNPNVISLLWLEPNYYIKVTDIGQSLLINRDVFSSKQIYHSFSGYAYSQLKKMTSFSFEGYMGEKRKKLVEKFGYDCKNAAHLIRLLRMAIEFLHEGVFFVQRPDATQLLDIKLGMWSLDQVKKEAENLFKRTEEAYDKSKLPNQVDLKKINELMVDCFKEHFYGEFI